MIQQAVSKSTELKQFAIAYKFRINPKYSFKYWGKLIDALGRCPCDTERKCPCARAVIEVKGKGQCLCNFFISEEEYARRTQGTKV